VISFSGERAKWSYWEEKFLARARRKGFKEILFGTIPIPKDSETLDLNMEEGKKKKKICELNELAFKELVLSIDTSSSPGKVAFQLVKMCKMVDHVNGDAALAWKRLLDKFAPRLAPTKLELKLEFQQSCLKSADEDLDEWIMNLEGIRSRLQEMNSDVSDEDFCIHVLNNLPSEYEVQVLKLEDQLGSVSNPLKIEDL